MPFLLPLAGDLPETSDARWAGFLARRAELTGRMELSTCDGCDQCGLRCMDGFSVTRTEWDAARTYLGTLPPSEVRRVREQNKTVPWPGAEDTGATVTFCQFRDMENGNCFVYPARATVCRLFGHTHWLPCPIEAVTQFPADAPLVWNEYIAWERKPWAEWDAVAAGEKEPEGGAVNRTVL